MSFLLLRYQWAQGHYPLPDGAAHENLLLDSFSYFYVLPLSPLSCRRVFAWTLVESLHGHFLGCFSRTHLLFCSFHMLPFNV